MFRCCNGAVSFSVGAFGGLVVDLQRREGRARFCTDRSSRVTFAPVRCLQLAR